jgi:hypothetical protein
MERYADETYAPFPAAVKLILGRGVLVLDSRCESTDFSRAFSE